jgi:Spy/CpxP family protein refolding chaperone
MKRTHRFLVAAAILAAAVGGSAARSFAHGPGGHMLERAVDSLRLDADTQARVDAVFDAARPAERDLGRTLRTRYEALRTMLADPTAKEAAVLAQAESIGTTQTELRKQELHKLFAVRAVLNADQQQQLSQAMQDMRGRHWHGRGSGGGPR